MANTAERLARASAWMDKPKNFFLALALFSALVFFYFLPTIMSGGSEGDVTLYRKWAVFGWSYDLWAGRDFSWVYPDGALLPISLVGVFGVKGFFAAWLALTLLLNLVAVLVLVRSSASSFGLRAAWFWLAVLFILSPVSLLRLEGITAPLAIIGLALLIKRPRIAALLLAVAAWIKVWPAAIFLAIIGSGVRRSIAIWTASIFSGVFVAAVWVSGGLSRITDFLTIQGGRNIQLEAVIGAPWLWLSVQHVDGFGIYDNVELSTRELMGPGSVVVAKLMTPIMVIVALSLVVIMWRITRNSTVATFDVLLFGSLAIVLTMIVFNSVGSPQYMLWIAPIVAVGYSLKPIEWERGMRLFIGIAILTSLVFPVLYMPLVKYSHFAALVLLTRNALVIVLFAWALRRLFRLARPSNDLQATPSGTRDDVVSR
jgi:hypothetical protein